jgi:hypothetical protein
MDCGPWSMDYGLCTFPPPHAPPRFPPQPGRNGRKPESGLAPGPHPPTTLAHPSQNQAGSGLAPGPHPPTTIGNSNPKASQSIANNNKQTVKANMNNMHFESLQSDIIQSHRHFIIQLNRVRTLWHTCGSRYGAQDHAYTNPT